MDLTLAFLFHVCAFALTRGMKRRTRKHDSKPNTKKKQAKLKVIKSSRRNNSRANQTNIPQSSGNIITPNKRPKSNRPSYGDNPRPPEGLPPDWLRYGLPYRLNPGLSSQNPCRSLYEPCKGCNPGQKGPSAPWYSAIEPPWCSKSGCTSIDSVTT
jgi:hypothetical protein